VRIEHRWANDEYERLPQLAMELAELHVSVIVAGPPTESTLAAKAALPATPIVFFGGPDPIVTGLVASYNRPGGNVTGVVSINYELETKRLGVLHDLLPSAGKIAVLFYPSDAVEASISGLQNAAHDLGLQLLLLRATNVKEVAEAFAATRAQEAAAMLVTVAAFYHQGGHNFASFSRQNEPPTLFFYRDFALRGGLIIYGTSRSEAWRQVGVYAGRLLKGEKAADLPVMQPTRFELVINLGTAKAFGLAIPPGILAIADEVIE